MKKINDMFAKSGIHKELWKNLCFSQLIKANWTHIVGEGLANQVVFQFLKLDCCILSVTNPCWVQEIEYYEKDILKKLNGILKMKNHVKKIRVTVIGGK